MLLALSVVIAAIALVIWQPWRSDGTPTPEPSSPTAAATGEPTDAPTTTEPEETAAPSESTPDPSVEPTIGACATRDIAVFALTDQAEYGAGENPQLTIELTNEGTASCYLNVGTTQQVFVITSGSDMWWRSTDCQTEPSDQVVQLDPGQTISSAAPLVWDRTRSSPETCDAGRQNALPGTYHLSVVVGGIGADDPARFVLR